MEFSYNIYVPQKLVVYRVDGKADREAAKQMYLTIVSDPNYDTSFKGIADWSHVVSHLSREDVIYIAELVMADQRLQQVWVALVSQPMSTALAAIYSQKVSGQHRVEICSTIEKASEIVGFDVRPYLL